MKTDLVAAIVRLWNVFQWSIIFASVAEIIAICPDSRLIAPCQCQTENNVVSMVCANLQSVQQLMKIFEPPFPVNQLWHLTVKHSHLDDLEANLLGDKSFAVILFQNVTGVSKIMPHAFAASVERLRVLTLDSSPSLGVLSVQGIADLENLVDFEVTASIDQLIDFPSLPNLQYLHLYGNRFSNPPSLPHLPKLHSLWLNSGKLVALKPLDLTFLPSLRKIVLFGNQLRQLDEGDLHFQSPRVDLIDLSDNDLSGGIHPSAIKGISFNTIIDLKKTNLTQLEEATFRPILSVLARGAGHVQLHGTMLQCDCHSFGWLLQEPKLMAKISQTSKCSDGVNIHFKTSRLQCLSNETIADATSKQ